MPRNHRTVSRGGHGRAGDDAVGGRTGRAARCRRLWHCCRRCRRQGYGRGGGVLRRRSRESAGSHLQSTSYAASSDGCPAAPSRLVGCVQGASAIVLAGLRADLVTAACSAPSRAGAGEGNEVADDNNFGGRARSARRGTRAGAAPRADSTGTQRPNGARRSIDGRGHATAQCSGSALLTEASALWGAPVHGVPTLRRARVRTVVLCMHPTLRCASASTRPPPRARPLGVRVATWTRAVGARVPRGATPSPTPEAGILRQRAGEKARRGRRTHCSRGVSVRHRVRARVCVFSLFFRLFSRRALRRRDHAGGWRGAEKGNGRDAEEGKKKPAASRRARSARSGGLVGLGHVSATVGCTPTGPPLSALSFFTQSYGLYRDPSRTPMHAHDHRLARRRRLRPWPRWRGWRSRRH